MSEKKVANIACRRASYKDGTLASGSSDTTKSCEGKEAEIVSESRGVHGHTLFKCVDCGFTWSVPTGGSINI
jgi:transposase-like protein